MGFQAQRIGIGTENFIVYSTVSQDPRCYSIVRLVRGDSMEEGQSAGQYVYDRLKSERYLEGFWMDIEDRYLVHPGDCGSERIQKRKGAGSDTVSVAGSYEEFLKQTMWEIIMP